MAIIHTSWRDGGLQVSLPMARREQASMQLASPEPHGASVKPGACAHKDSWVGGGAVEEYMKWAENANDGRSTA